MLNTDPIIIFSLSLILNCTGVFTITYQLHNVDNLFNNDQLAVPAG